MDNGPLSPDSADFMALLEKHLAANESVKAQPQAMQQQKLDQIFPGNGFDGRGDQGGASRGGSSVANGGWYGSMAGMMQGYGGQHGQQQLQQQGQTQYNLGQGGMQSTMGAGMTLSPESDFGNSGSSNTSYNYFGQATPHQSSTSSLSSNGGYPSQPQRTATGKTSTDAEPAQLQMAQFMTDMLRNGNFDANAVKQLGNYLQSQPQSQTRAQSSVPAPQPAQTRTFGGIPAVPAPATAPAQPSGMRANMSAQDMIQALYATGLMPAQEFNQAPAKEDAGNFWNGSNEQAGAMFTRQFEQQKREQASMLSGANRSNQNPLAKPSYPISSTTNQAPQQWSGTNSDAFPHDVYSPFSTTSGYPQTSAATPLPPRTDQTSANGDSTATTMAMLLQLQNQGGGFPPALMSNPAFLQALRAAGGPVPQPMNATNTFGVPGNWPLPGIETPEGSTGKAGTESGGSQIDSPPSDSQQQSKSKGRDQDRHVNGQPTTDQRPKASLPGKKVSAGAIVQQVRQTSGSSRSQSHSASPEAELHQKRKAETDESAGQPNHKHKGAVSDDMDDHEDDSEEEESGPHAGTSKRKGAVANRRKSTNTGPPPLPNPNEANLDPTEKAYRRKQQNRAAQKAFRERREQRVKDLEDRLAEMEAKAAGRDQENETLRQLLSKLQQENINLQSSSFSFSGPLGGSGAYFDDAGKDGRLNTVEKLPSPPLSLVDSRTQSMNGAIPPLDRQDSSSGSGSTPASNAHASGSSQNAESPLDNTSAPAINGFHPDPYNAFAAGPKSFGKVGGASGHSGFPSLAGIDQNASPGLLQGGNIADVLSHMQGGIFTQTETAKSPFTMLAENPEFTSFRDASYQGYGDFGLNDSAMDGLQNPFEDESAMNDFLRSLGAGPEENDEMDGTQTLPAPPRAGTTETTAGSSPGPGGVSIGSELFGSYFRGFGAKILTPPANKGKSPQGFSPADYLITSPEAVGSTQLDPLAPATEAAAKELGVADGQLDSLMDISTFGVANASDELLTCKILMRDGTHATAVEVWKKIQDKLDFTNGFDLDDLCDQMKSKAVCSVTADGVMTEESIDDFVRDYQPVAVQTEKGVWTGGWGLKDPKTEQKKSS